MYQKHVFNTIICTFAPFESKMATYKFKKWKYYSLNMYAIRNLTQMFKKMGK